MITDNQKTLIQQIINVFETGTPEGEYDKLVIYDDGINDTEQITYGRSQTTEQGNLLNLIELYVEMEGCFANDFTPYLTRIGDEPLVDDERFKGLLKQAGCDDPVMCQAQDQFFDRHYWQPAAEWFERNGFEQPLSMLVTYDSYIHSGRIPMFLRKRFMACPPARGGSETGWVSAYTEARHQWLKYHSKKLLRRTIYRTQTFLDLIQTENWDLDQRPINANGVAVG